MKNLILCGFMGSGKTTVGSILAEKLGAEFVDMDAYIESKTGMLVFEIFDLFGEEKFRRFETEAAEELSRRQGIVVACGGGTVLNPRNAELFRKTGRIVLLDVPYSAIVRRLSGDRSRPLLNRKDREHVMQQLYLARMPVYRSAADFTVSGGEQPAGEVADEILRVLRNNSETL